MTAGFPFFQDAATSAWMIALAKSAVYLGIGILAARITRGAVVRALKKRAAPQQLMLVSRIVYFSILALFAISALREMGLQMSVVLGAAGVLTVAIGFASQTSVSNLISGLFLIGERPFVVGDIIKAGDTTGEVLSIDLLSVKLRTFDNLYVRVPNESLIKSQITNLTHFPIRRLDVQVGLAYKEDIDKARKILIRVAEKNVFCLEEPKPLFIFLGFGDSALNIQFSVWAKREHFLDLRNGIHEEIKRAFDAEGIEIPFPHLSLYAGSATDPFPVKVVG